MSYFNFSNDKKAGDPMKNVPEAWRDAVEGFGVYQEPAAAVEQREGAVTENGFIDETSNYNSGDNLDKYKKDFDTSVAGKILRTSAYKKYFYNSSDVLREAKNISTETGIPENAILNSAENLDRAREIYDYRRKQMALVPPGENEFDMEKVYQAYPGLDKLAQQDDNDAAIALHNMKNVKETHGIVESAVVGWQLDTLQHELSKIGKAGLYGNLTKDDLARADELQKQLSEMKEIPDLFSAPVASIVGGVAQQSGLLGRGFLSGQRLGAIGGGLGAVVGGVLAGSGTLGTGAPAGAIAGAKVGYTWGTRLGMAQDMYEESAGLNYLKYRSYKDKNGKQLLTDNQVRAYSVAAAAVETGIEFQNAGMILKTLRVGTEKNILTNIINSAKDNESFRAALVNYVKNGARNIGAIAFSESAEEGAQEVSNMLVTNLAGENNPGGNIPHYSIEDMVSGAASSFWQSLPASIGFGITAQGGSTLGIVRRGAAAMSIRDESSKLLYKNINGMQLLEGIKENMHTSELFRKDAAVYNAVLKNTLDGSGFDTVYVDTEMVLQEDGGMELLQTLADRTGISRDQFAEIIDSKANLSVPTAVYAQAALPVESGDKLQDYISFDAAAECLARNKFYAKRLKREMDSIVGKDMQHQAEIVDAVLQENFAEGEERDAAAFVFLRHPDDPARGLKEERQRFVERQKEMLEPIVKQLETGMGNGVAFVRDENTGKYITYSNNDSWYSKYYAENKKTPSKAELKNIAYDILSGDNKYSVPGYENDTAEAAEYYAAQKAEYDEMERSIQQLDAVTEKINAFDKGELAVTEGLSREGYQVYRNVAAKLKNAPTKGSRMAGNAGAIILARHADRIAEVMRESGRKNYTAMDYYKDRIGINFDGKPGVNALKQAGSFVVELNGDEFGEYKDISELRSKAVDYYRKNLQGTTVHNEVLGDIRIGKGMTQNDLAFTKKGRDKMKISSAKADKLLAVRYLREIIEGAKFITEADGGNGKHDDEHFYYLHSMIEVNGEGKYAIATIKENSEQQLIYYNHNVFEPAEYKKIEDALNEALGTGDTSSSQNPQKASSFTDSISGKGTIYKQQRVYNQTAFHGSPHKFKNFDLGAIGTGEGAQAHGWGLYFAKDKKIASNNYRFIGKAADNSVTVGGEPILELAYRLADTANYTKDPVKAQEYYDKVTILEDVESSGTTAGITVENYPEAAVKWFKREIKPRVRIKGSLFEVDIPENNVLLDEQKALAKQDKNVKSLLKKFYAELNNEQKRILKENLKQSLKKGSMSEEYEKNAARKSEVDLTLSRLDRLEPQEGEPKYAAKIREFSLSELKDAGYDIDRLKTDQQYYDSIVEPLKAEQTALQEVLTAEEQSIEGAYNKELERIEKSRGAGLFEGNVTGGDLYAAISEVFGSGRDASEALNAAGIKGITYDGDLDGRCFVVFDDQAIKVINKYNQDVNNKGDIRGQIGEYSDGRRIISLFETANQSTFAHETGHLFLMDLKEMAEIENASALVKKDWETAKEWLSWEKEQTNFTVDQQEKWAKAFEAYLRTGKAPASNLQSVFRKFKKWLTALYKDIKQLGGKPSPEISAVMDRMIATQEEIDIALKRAEYESFIRSGGQEYMTGGVWAMYNRMLYKAREEAEEKVLKLALNDVTEAAEQGRKEALENERKKITEELGSEPVFIVAEYLKNNPQQDMESTAVAFGLTPAEYKEKLATAGGSLDAAVDERMRQFTVELDRNSFNEAELKKQAETAVQESKYRKLATALEMDTLENMVKAQRRLSMKVGKAIGEDIAKEAGKAMAKLTDKEKTEAGLRALRDVAAGHMQQLNTYVEEKLEKMDLQTAANAAMWRNLSRRAQDECGRAMVKKHWDEALKAKKQQLMYDIFTDKAAKNAKEVEKTVQGLKKKSETMRKSNNVPANDRFAYNHLLYVFGMVERDALMPPGYEGFMKVLSKRDENLEMPYLDSEGNIDLPEWLLNAATGVNQRQNGYRDLTIAEFEGLADVMRMIYKTGAEENKTRVVTDAEGNTVDIDVAIQEIGMEASANVAPKKVRDYNGFENPGVVERLTGQSNELHVRLIKAETIFRQMGEKAMQYLYNPLKLAADKEMVMAENLQRDLKDIFGVYSKTEMTKIRNKKAYKLGSSMLTKENLIVVALNWGTDINRKRVMNGHNVTEFEVNRALANLDSKDWQLVENIWALFDEYWPETQRIEAEVTGAVLEKQPAMPFKIIASDGMVYNLSGGYYPLKYDASKNTTVGERAGDDAKRASMAGMMRLGLHKGHTKQRVQGKVRLKLRTDFGVISEGLTDVIHLIAFREPVRDVNRIIQKPEFGVVVENLYGVQTNRMLRKWVLDCWAVEPQYKNGYERAMKFAREKQTLAVLGFRLTTAILNGANIGPMAEYIGPGNAASAIKRYYANGSEFRSFILDKSVFMRERAQTMDRDIGAIVKQGGVGSRIPGYDTMQKNAFKLLAETDLALALPLWLHEYEKVYQDAAGKQMSAEMAEREATVAGDAAVRRVFGSGLTLDLAEVQKGGEIMKGLTMYYSYFSVVYQAMAMKIAESNKGRFDKVGFQKIFMPVARGLLMWILIPSVYEALMREGAADDDWDWGNVGKRTASTFISTLVGGIPLMRDAVPYFLQKAFEGKRYAIRPLPIYEAAAQAARVADTITSDRKGKLDATREVLRLFNMGTGISNTVTDGLVTTAQWADSDFDAAVAEYLRAVVMDRKLKK